MKKMMILGVLALILLGSFVCAAEKLNLSDIPFEFQRDANASNYTKLVVPDWMVPPARVLFNLGAEGQLTLSLLIVLIALFAFIFVVLASVMRLMPFFRGGAKRWIASAMVTILASIAGGIREPALFFMGFQGNVGRLASLWFVVILLIIAVFGWTIIKLLKMVEVKLNLESAEQTGRNISLKSFDERTSIFGED